MKIKGPECNEPLAKGLQCRITNLSILNGNFIGQEQKKSRKSK